MPTFVPIFVTTSAFYLRLSAVLLFYCIFALVFHLGSLTILLFCRMPALISCFRSFAILLSYYIPILAAFAAFSLPCHAFISCHIILALLLPLFVLGLLFSLKFLFFKIFKQSLLDKLWLYMLTSSAKFFCPFLALSIYNLNNNNGLHNPINNNKLKRGFNTAFINSYLLANNPNQKEINLSFIGCEYPNAVKFNRSW